MSKRTRILAVAGLGLALLASLPSRVNALTDEEIFRNFRFNFINPGGRAGAMGGSFIGIADDATAAAANPAGLTNLINPELFTEVRYESVANREFSTLAARDNFAFDVDMDGTIDPTLLSSAGESDDIINSSFISYVYPFEKWVIGVSRQELLNSDIDTLSCFTLPDTGIPGLGSDARDCDEEDDDFPIAVGNGTIKTLLDSYNVSLAFRGGEKFAAGITLSLQQLDVQSRVDNLFQFGAGLQPDYATEIDDSDTDIGWSAGILIKPIDKFHIGLVYKDGGEFQLTERLIDTDEIDNFNSALVLADFLGDNDGVFDDSLEFQNTFVVPDQYGIGLGIKPTDKLTIAIDAVHVEFSDLEKGFIGGLNTLTFINGIAVSDEYFFDDATIYHLGLEYVWSINDKTPFALRVGAYTDPNTQIETKFKSEPVFAATNDDYPSGDEEVHATIGFGFVLQEKFQADFAFDISDAADSFVTSFIYHF